MRYYTIMVSTLYLEPVVSIYCLKSERYYRYYSINSIVSEHIRA